MGNSQNIGRWFLVSTSAFCAAAAYLCPQFFAELTFIFLVPLFFAATRPYLLSHKDGLWWGFLFYSLFFHDIFDLIITKGHGFGRIIAPFFLIIYASCSTGVWFYGALSLSYFFQKNHKSLLRNLFCWGLTTWYYFYWVDSSFFFIFGQWEGNQLNHCTVPLAMRPQWLYWLPLFGKEGYLLLIVTGVIAFILLFHTFYRTHAFLVLVCCWGLLAYGWIMKSTLPAPSWLSVLGCAKIVCPDDDPWGAAEQIMQVLEGAHGQHPEVTCLIMPESSFKFPLNDFIRVISLWQGDEKSSLKTLIIGSHRRDGTTMLFNTLYHLEEGAIKTYYDKRHTLFFTERIPRAWELLPGAKDLFLKDLCTFASSKDVQRPLLLKDIGRVIPLICSDLFFGSHGDAHAIYLCIINDNWFRSIYIPRLMFLHAKATALLTQSSFIYVGYRYSFFIDSGGKEWPLATIS